jgi:hypothetical protein
MQPAAVLDDAGYNRTCVLFSIPERAARRDRVGVTRSLGGCNVADESADKLLLEVAVRLTDKQVRADDLPAWLRMFRRTYRHMSATVRFIGAATAQGADKVTDAAFEADKTG